MDSLTNIITILEPFISIIKSLFTRDGLVILILIIVGILLLNVMLELLKRYPTPGSQRDVKWYYKLLEVFVILIDKAKSMASFLATNVTTLIVIFFISLGLVAIYENLNFVKAYSEKLQRIEELESVIQQLNDDRPIAGMEITGMEEDTISVSIEFYNPNLPVSSPERVVNELNVTLKGNLIYLGFININFEYSKIEQGEKRNITVPRVIYSDLVSSDEGVQIDYKDDKGVFYSLVRPDDEIYSMTSKAYQARSKEISRFFGDKDFARQNGVRSINGVALAKYGKVGDVFNVFTLQSGGLNIVKKEDKLHAKSTDQIILQSPEVIEPHKKKSILEVLNVFD